MQIGDGQITMGAGVCAYYMEIRGNTKDIHVPE